MYKIYQYIFINNLLSEIFHSHTKSPVKIIIPGSAPYSDLCCSASTFKNIMKEFLLEIQKQGDAIEWKTLNFEIPNNVTSLKLKWLEK